MCIHSEFIVQVFLRGHIFNVDPDVFNIFNVLTLRSENVKTIWVQVSFWEDGNLVLKLSKAVSEDWTQNEARTLLLT